MTDVMGRRARWSAAALLAPASAAAFAGATVWALHHDPREAAVADVTATAAPVDPVVLELREAVAASHKHLATLRTGVVGLRTQAASLTRSTKSLRAQAAAASAASSSSGSSGSGSSGSGSSGSGSGGSGSSGSSGSGSSGSGGGTVTVYVPSTPPASSGSTGASGAVK